LFVHHRGTEDTENDFSFPDREMLIRKEYQPSGKLKKDLPGHQLAAPKLLRRLVPQVICQVEAQRAKPEACGKKQISKTTHPPA
jgi:hypothetical protein